MYFDSKQVIPKRRKHGSTSLRSRPIGVRLSDHDAREGIAFNEFRSGQRREAAGCDCLLDDAEGIVNLAI
jgi:hypothetical protein